MGGARESAGEGTATIPRPKIDPSLTAAATYRLLVVDGPDRGKSLGLDGTQPSSILIGQSPVCAMQLSDPMVSRRHLALDHRGRRLHLLDLASTNGTAVNGVAVADVFLAGGETIRIGETAIKVELEAAATAVPLTSAVRFGRVVGASATMRRLYPLCQRLAMSSIPVVVEGQTGTGKELLAESIHEQSPRAAGPFVVFDCTAVPPSLVESDLFGHERGAFTGAVGARRGVFEQADGGTLLIDEIGDLDPTLQPKLLRAIERSEIRRVGGERPIRVDVRVLCATRRDLDREVQAGRFRDDLFHRLAVGRCELPRLRDRQGDVTVLTSLFCEQYGGGQIVPDHVLARWEEYDWPGNVRELRNAVMRYLALEDDGLPGRTTAELAPASTPTPDADGVLERIVAAGLPYRTARQRVLDEFEGRYLERVLAQHGGNVMRAAEASGIARRQLQRVKARVAGHGGK
jgi:transcriptional regulator with GAF, ATPase, and Fis domain